ncbi:hypothetical protein ACFL3I_05360 [Pseudomonadota bacterium]
MKNLDKLLDSIDLALNSKLATPEDQLKNFGKFGICRLMYFYPDEDFIEASDVLFTLQQQGHISKTDTVEQLRELCISINTSSPNTVAEPVFSAVMTSEKPIYGTPMTSEKPIYNDPPSAYAVAKAEGRVVKLHKVIDMLLEGFDRPDGFLNRHDKIHAKLDKYRAELHEAETALHKMMGRQ